MSCLLPCSSPGCWPGAGRVHVGIDIVPAKPRRPSGEVATGGPAGHVRGARRDPQDQARDHRHAGEPVVRQLLRHLSRARTASRCSDGVPTVCVPNPAGGCTRPYHDTADVNGGGPHGEANAVADVNGGMMNGFIRQRDVAQATCHIPDDPACIPGRPARRDGLPHRRGDTQLLDLRQGLRARRPHVRAGEVVVAARPPVHGVGLVGPVPHPLAHELRQRHRRALRGEPVRPGRARGTDRPARPRSTWPGPTSPGCCTPSTSAGPTTSRPASSPTATTTRPRPATPVQQSATTPGIWNPLPLFGDVQQDHQLHNIQPLGSYFRAAKAGTLPSVSWITPSGDEQRAPARPASTRARRTSPRSSTPP